MAEKRINGIWKISTLEYPDHLQKDPGPSIPTPHPLGWEKFTDSVKHIVISKHAHRRMNRRGSAEEQIYKTVWSPDQRVQGYGGRKIVQKNIEKRGKNIYCVLSWKNILKISR